MRRRLSTPRPVLCPPACSHTLFKVFYNLLFWSNLIILICAAAIRSILSILFSDLPYALGRLCVRVLHPSALVSSLPYIHTPPAVPSSKLYATLYFYTSASLWGCDICPWNGREFYMFNLFHFPNICYYCKIVNMFCYVFTDLIKSTTASGISRSS